MKLLMACDDSTDVKGLVADLRRAGLPPAVDAVVLSVADMLPIPSTPAATPLPAAVRHAREQAARAIEAAQRMAESAAVQLRAAFPAWRIEAEAQADAPAWAIVKKADAWVPDLIAVGSHDRSALGRVLLGSVSHAVLTHIGSGSVRIARPPRAEPDTPQRLLVGIDGSPGATATVAAVAARHWLPGSEVRIVAALDATLASLLGLVGESSADRDAVDAIVERAAATLRAAGLTVSTGVVGGNPKHVLVDEAESWNADCVFVGARGLRAAERFLLGSVSESVAARARCSVEVVRP